MNDRELLEMAARAAGYTFIDYHDPKQDRDARLSTTWSGPWAEVRKPAFAAGYCRWNPLTDDGDALRLAVRLQLQIRPNDYDVMVVAHLPAHITVAEVCDHKDPYAATRRAIVRAAAEIGREMKE